MRSFPGCILTRIVENDHVVDDPTLVLHHCYPNAVTQMLLPKFLISKAPT
jgi:hypothetical protein